MNFFKITKSKNEVTAVIILFFIILVAICGSLWLYFSFQKSFTVDKEMLAVTASQLESLKQTYDIDMAGVVEVPGKGFLIPPLNIKPKTSQQSDYVAPSNQDNSYVKKQYNVLPSSETKRYEAIKPPLSLLYPSGWTYQILSEKNDGYLMSFGSAEQDQSEVIGNIKLSAYYLSGTESNMSLEDIAEIAKMKGNGARVITTEKIIVGNEPAIISVLEIPQGNKISKNGTALTAYVFSQLVTGSSSDSKYSVSIRYFVEEKYSNNYPLGFATVFSSLSY